MPPFHIWCTLFYDYSINTETIQSAIATTLSRYGELAGRIVIPAGKSRPMIHMDNQGALLTITDQSDVTIKELKKKQFENDFVFATFCETDDDEDEDEDDNINGNLGDSQFGESISKSYLLKVKIQPLADGGMVLGLGFHYQVCDVNSMYVFTADLCSLIRRGGIFAFKESQLQVCMRCEVFKPNDEHIQDHPEFEIARSEETQAKWEALIKDTADNPRMNIRFQISRKSLETMRDEICVKHPNEVPVSTNDCVASVFWKACVKGMPKAKPADVSVFQLACNGRFRKKPPLPRTFFGNATFIVYTSCHKEKLCKDSAYRTACRIRKSVLKVTESYMQSVINFVEQEGADNVQFSAGHQPLDFSVTNWNQYFDWYKDGDMGHGRPVKFLIVSKTLAGMAIILPGSPDGMEVLTGLTKEQFQTVLNDSYVKKYFTWC
ncbi:uncharacterized protein LOC142348466 isoform X2 [Convolutriloba macropyga]